MIRILLFVIAIELMAACDTEDAGAKIMRLQQQKESVCGLADRYMDTWSRDPADPKAYSRGLDSALKRTVKLQDQCALATRDYERAKR